jgi:ketosteroid isomerase-like protein
MAGVEYDNKQTLQRFLELSIRGADRAVLESMMHEDICVYEAVSLPFGGEHRGKDAYFALVRRVFHSWKDVKLEVHRYIAEGDTVVVLAEIRGASPRTGERFSMPLAEVWTFRDGRIATVTPYYHDTCRLLAY